MGRAPLTLSSLRLFHDVRPRWILAGFLAALHAGCDRGSGSAARSSPSGGQIPGAAAVQFVERSKEAGIEFKHQDGSSGKYFITETISGGVALFDFDGDGDLDLYFVNGRPLPPGAPPAAWAKDCSRANVLYRNDGTGPDGVPRFTDVTERAGVPGTGFGVGCCVGDYDGDGDLDLFVTQLGPDVLYRNNGDGAFTDVTAAAFAPSGGVGDPRFSAGCAFGDVDGDGWLDLYVSNYASEDFEKHQPCLTNNIPHYCAPYQYAGEPDSLFLNQGNGTFRDASESSGIRKVKPGRGLAVRMTDLDGDGRPEIVVANDGSANFLFQNLGGGKFKEIALEAGVAFSRNGEEQGNMGVDAADYDGDGLLDVAVTVYQKQTNAVYHNEGNLIFSERGMNCGVAADSLPLVSWGVKFFDANNDGIPDLFIANGHMEDRIEEYDQSSTYLQRSQFFLGKGDGTFREATSESGPGLQLRRSARGAASGDLDNDGDLDIVVGCWRDRPLLLLNQSAGPGHWIGLDLRGKAPNRFAVGARATVWSGGRRMVQEVQSGGSYISQNDLRLHFGLGGASEPERIEVRWPDGKTEAIIVGARGARAGSWNRVVEGEGVVPHGSQGQKS